MRSLVAAFLALWALLAPAKAQQISAPPSPNATVVYTAGASGTYYPPANANWITAFGCGAGGSGETATSCSVRQPFHALQVRQFRP